jgi:hypothetical protein
LNGTFSNCAITDLSNFFKNNLNSSVSLNKKCFFGTFERNYSLQTAPNTTLTITNPQGNFSVLSSHEFSFCGMFRDCSELTDAQFKIQSGYPGHGTFEQMFINCTKLSTINLNMISSCLIPDNTVPTNAVWR